MEERSFADLKEKALDTRLCFFCGTCVAVCPAGCIAFGADGPELDGECTSCGQCVEACPGLGAPLDALDRVVFGRERTRREDASGQGLFLEEKNLISADREIRRIGYTGGKLTATLAFLLEKGEIDAAIVSRWGEASAYPWFSWPTVATTRQELIAAAGSKYVFSPNLMALGKVAAQRQIRSVALVGLACHMQGLRKLQHLGEPYARLAEKVRYAFGLYCGAPMVARQDLMRYMADLCKVEPHRIARINVRRVSREFDVNLEIGLKDGGSTGLRINVMEFIGTIRRYPRWHRCNLCTDYSAEYADIAFGGSHVTARTPVGVNVLTAAVKEGYLVPAPAIEELDKMSRQFDLAMTAMKKEENRQRIAALGSENKPVPRYH